MKPRVISYIRFSSQRQSKGRSEERQSDAAREWCQQNGMELDESIEDLGVSAFTGKHRRKGNLSAFLEQVEAGKVPAGSYLLVEAFDRLTREEIDEADVLVKSILRKGVNIVTLLDGHVYTKKSLNNIASLISMILAFGQSHEESFRKGGRVSQTFERKRKEGKKVFGTAPGWLRRGPEGKEGDWVVVPELAAVVVKVFEAAKSGLGGPAIARKANAEGWPVPTRKTKISTEHWHAKMPQIILRNRAVLGEAQHVIRGRNALEKMESKEPVPAGPPIKDYYPRIVSDELWRAARGEIDRRRTAPPKRDKNYFNIFSGLLRCGNCGAPVQRKTEPRGTSKAQLICTSKMAGLTKCRTASASKTDATLLIDICAYASNYLGLGYDKDAVLDDVTVAEQKLKELATKIKNVIELSKVTGPVPEVIEEIGRLTKEREELENLIEEKRQTLSLEPDSLFETSYADQVIEKLYDPSDEAMMLRADCNARLRRAIDVVWLWAYDMCIVQYKHSDLRQTVVLQTKTDMPFRKKRPNYDRPAFEASLAGLLKVPELKKGK